MISVFILHSPWDSDSWACFVFPAGGRRGMEDVVVEVGWVLTAQPSVRLGYFVPCWQQGIIRCKPGGETWFRGFRLERHCRVRLHLEHTQGCVVLTALLFSAHRMLSVLTLVSKAGSTVCHFKASFFSWL